MAGVIRTNCSTILAAVAARLVFWEVATADRIIFIARRTDIPHFGAEKDILLWPRGFTVDRDEDDAAGRHATLIHRRLSVVCRTRNHLDEAGRDKVWLTQATTGHLALEEGVADALHQFWPSNAAGDQLLKEPMKLLDGDDPNKEPEDLSWGRTVLTFKVDYYLNLDQSE